jgi:hypothetical protein
MALFCGIDWAETQHDVAIIDDDSQLVAKKRIAEVPAVASEWTAAGESRPCRFTCRLTCRRGFRVCCFALSSGPAPWR